MRPRSVVDDNVIKIRFLNQDGSLSITPLEIDLIPVIEVEVSQASSTGVRTFTALALVDTGADHRVIDKSFAEECKFLSAGTTTSSGIGGFARDINFYWLEYHVTTNGNKHNLSGNFVAPSLTETGRKYQLILGMSF
ncbi:aspartyl protease family protein [Pseudomonas cannabina]|nr:MULTISPECIES: aspartyl protease family protein [Pseudomonas syringae group]QQN21242.1 aspartyl protease family protein [Pseudomonas cannabina pv. alisalensis]